MRISRVFLVSSIGLLSACAAIALTSSWPINDDGKQYLEIANHVRAGQGFQLDGALTMVREPGYPIFLAAVLTVTHGSLLGIRLAQAILFACGMLLLYLIAKELAGERYALAAIILMAVLPQLVVYPSLILSETLTMFLLLVSLYMFVRATASTSLLGVAATAAVTGLLVLTRSTALPLVLVYAAFLAFSHAPHRWLRAAFFVVVVVAMLLPWSLRNHHAFGSYGLASRGGLVMYVRATRATFTAHDHALLFMRAALGDWLTSRFEPDIIAKQDYLDTADIMWTKRETLLATGVSENEIEHLFGAEAMTMILTHPVNYVTDGAYEFLMLNMVALPFADMRTLFVGTHHEIPNALKDMIAIGLRLINFAAMFLVWFGIWQKRKNVRFWPLALIVIAWATAYVLTDAVPRYAVPILPLEILFAVEGIAALRTPTVGLLHRAGFRTRPESSS